VDIEGSLGGGPAKPVHKRVAGRVPGLRAAVLRAKWMGRELGAVAYGLRAGRLGTRAAGRRRLSRQAPTVAVDAPALDLRDPAEALRATGLRFTAGRSGAYLPPQPGLESVLGSAARLYPPGAGVKLTAGVDDAVRERLVAANVLHAAGIGPRVYDAVELAGGGTAFVVEHAGEDPVDDSARARTADHVMGIGGLRFCRGWDDPDHFVRSDGGPPVFVGFAATPAQDLDAAVRRALSDEVRRDLHYGSEYALKGRRYLYQSVPAVAASGRRNTLRRLDAIERLLDGAGRSVAGRLTLDVGCNAGVMLASTLAGGAAWGLGWDLPHVADRGRILLGALGFTRFDLFGAELEGDYDVLADVPPHLEPLLGGSTVLYLAIRHHVGFLRSLARFDWETMVYEGSEDESVGTLPEHLRDLRELCDFEVAAAVDFRDGETRPRPLAVLVRS
jgi:hypothetical protein